MEFNNFNPVEGVGLSLDKPIEDEDIFYTPSSKSSDIPIQQTSEYDFLNQYKTYDQIISETRQQQPVQTNDYKYRSYIGYSQFSKLYDQVEQEMPEAKKYRKLLTEIARHESGFNSSVQNKQGAPAYGYFQFMQDGKKYNNIKTYSGLSIADFRNNPKEQIKAAVRLAQTFEKALNNSDISKAQANGISLSGLIGGAWLGGIGGVRQVLNGTGNPSDRHWSKNNKGSNVAACMQRYNNLI